MPETTEANTAAGSVPVNVAVPDWQCPHCKKRYGANYDAACVCAAAGPADDVADGVIVMDLTASTWSKEKPVFGVAEPGPVTAVYEERVVVAHRRDVTVADRTIDSRELVGASPGELVVIRDSRARGGTRPLQTQTAALRALGVQARSSSSWTTPGSDGLRPIREVTAYKFPEDSDSWFGPLGERRDVAEMLVGFLDDLAATDPDDLVRRWLETDPRRAHRSIGGVWAALRFEMLDTVVAAHGAPDVSTGTRWLTDHAEAVADWTARQIVAWAGGADVVVPALSWSTSQKLPRSPGKKRLALMERVGCDEYRTALRAVTDAVTAPAPTCPVPDLGDVVTEYTAAAAAQRKDQR